MPTPRATCGTLCPGAPGLGRDLAFLTGAPLARRGMAFLTSPGDFRHTKVPYYMLGSYPISYFGFQKISKNDLIFVCYNPRENEADERNGQKSTSAFALFFSSTGPYYMPKGHIDGRGGLRSTLARPFHVVTLFIGPPLAWCGMAFLTSPGDFRHTKVPYYMLGSYPIIYFGFQKISKNDLCFVCYNPRENEADERNGQKSTSTFAIFFPSKGPYYMP